MRVAPITVIGTREGYAWKESPEFNFVDTHVNAKLRKMKLWASELCSDAEFLRRISLDLTGLPPNIDQSRAFVADPRDSVLKRHEKIEELLSSSAFVDHWTLKWSDLLLNKRKYVKEKGRLGLPQLDPPGPGSGQAVRQVRRRTDDGKRPLARKPRRQLLPHRPRAECR